MNESGRTVGPSPLQALVFGDRPESRYLSGRTLRTLRRLGVVAYDVVELSAAELGAKLASSSNAVWLVRAGAWPTTTLPIAVPPASATGAPLCAVGAIVAECDATGAGDRESAAWQTWQEATGGCVRRNEASAFPFPEIASVYLESQAVASLAVRLTGGAELPAAITAELAASNRRVVRLQAFDVRFCARLRVAQIVTSLQLGGAERVALDLHRTLPQQGIRSRLITLGSPTREAFDVPPHTIDVSRRADRIEAARQAVLDFVADVVHGHLLNADDVRKLSAAQLPVLLTIHNMQPGWPTGLATLNAGDAALFVACSQAVERDLVAANTAVPTRTVWNGIDFAPLKSSPQAEAAGLELRRKLGFDAADLVLLSLANPRPQKRLERLPAIVEAAQAELDRRGISKRVQLVIAGEASRGATAAQDAERSLAEAIAACRLVGRIHRLGAVKDLPQLLAAADILISCSAYEGLSLAHLEALAAGLPVVASDVGGTAEIAYRNEAMRLVSAEASAEDYAAAIVDLAQQAPSAGREQAAAHFTCTRMAAGYRALYPRALEAARIGKPRRGIWLIANNFSTGGAQSSARRLVLGLAREGVPVRAAVLQEQPEYPTPGRSVLLAAGIRVVAIPPAGSNDAADAVAQLLQQLDEDRPEAVVFWNVIATYKLLLAHHLLDVPIFDVSPGEMYFDSLLRYFENPRAGLPYRTPQGYGHRLAGIVVKYQAEAQLAQSTLGAPVSVVPNGVAIPPYEDTGARPPREKLVIGTAARLAPQKKLEDLFAALRAAEGRLPPYVLKIAGAAETGSEGYAESLRQLGAGLPIEWLGERTNLRDFHRDLDLFAMISEPAGCPNASLEAMAAGLPIVATDVGGAAEQIVDRVTGRITARGDAEAFAEALIELGRDPNLRRKYGKAAQRRAESHFSERRMIAAYRSLFLGLNSPR